MSVRSMDGRLVERSAPRKSYRGGHKATRAVASRATLALVAMAAALALASTAEATPPFPTHRCGTFKQKAPGSPTTTYRITVLNGRVSCHTATRVIRAFWSDHGVTHHGGPSDAQSYWTLKGFPGWRCGQGAGAGACTRGNQIAGYEVH